MAYDESVAQRVRDLIGDEPGWTERKMFGGLGFMINGNMAVAANSAGAIMMRVPAAVGAALVDGVRYRPMEMRGRSMTGWLSVDATTLPSAEEFSDALRPALDYARSLPPK